MLGIRTGAISLGAGVDNGGYDGIFVPILFPLFSPSYGLSLLIL
jgi:hypothetical protein